MERVEAPAYCSVGSVFGDVCGVGQWCHLGADRDATVCCPGGTTFILRHHSHSFPILPRPPLGFNVTKRFGLTYYI